MKVDVSKLTYEQMERVLGRLSSNVLQISQVGSQVILECG